MDLPHPADRICSAASGGAVSGTRSGALGRGAPAGVHAPHTICPLVGGASSDADRLRLELGLALDRGDGPSDPAGAAAVVLHRLGLLLRLRKVKTSQL